MNLRDYHVSTYDGHTYLHCIDCSTIVEDVQTASHWPSLSEVIRAADQHHHKVHGLQGDQSRLASYPLASERG